MSDTPPSTCVNCRHWHPVQDSDSIVDVPIGEDDRVRFARLQGWCKLTALGDAFNLEVVESKAIAFDVDGYDAQLKTAPDFYCNQFSLLLSHDYNQF
jgi:hypothetical protein